MAQAYTSSVGCMTSSEWEFAKEHRALPDWKVLEKGRAGIAAVCGKYGVIGNCYQGYLVVSDSMQLEGKPDKTLTLEAAIKEAERLELAARANAVAA